jgi:SAM-dependent methyltransferase
MELSRLFSGLSVLDLGCGYGQYVHYLTPMCSSVEGYDGNPLTPTLSRGLCKVADLTEPQIFKPAQWVLCLEVGEHVPRGLEEPFLDNIAFHALYGVVISWAVRGQGGRGHINTHTPEEVENLFLARPRCFAKNALCTSRLREAASFSYFKRNLLVLNRLFSFKDWE